MSKKRFRFLEHSDRTCISVTLIFVHLVNQTAPTEFVIVPQRLKLLDTFLWTPQH